MFVFIVVSHSLCGVLFYFEFNLSISHIFVCTYQRKKSPIMKAVVQKVTTAKVTVGDEEVNSIAAGLCVFVGFSKKDTEKDIDYMVRKLLALRLFEDENGKRWQKSVQDTNNEILCVSQFSLYNKLKGNTPDFHQAMQGDEAHTFYNNFLQKLSNIYSGEKIKDGRFGVRRIVHIQNDGPVTISLESPVSE